MFRTEDMIIVAILLVLVLIGIRSTIKHFKGEGGCCGGGSTVKIKKKRLKHVLCQKVVTIEGMSCEHCKNRVESRLNELAGISAKVDLKKGKAVISMEQELSDERIREIIEKAGYQVTSIEV